MAETFDLSELEDFYTDRAMVNEATARATVRKGDYVVDVRQATPRVANEQSMTPGRKGLNLQLAVMDEGKTITLWQDVSWELYRISVVAGERTLVKPGDEGYDTSLPLDKQSKLWSQIDKLYNPHGDKTIPEVARALAGSQIGAFIMEGFINEANEMRWPDARPKDFSSMDEYKKAYDEEKATAASAGYLPKNFISNFHKVKA